MVQFHFVAHLVDVLFKRFDAIGKADVVCGECVEGKAQDLINRLQQHVQLMLTQL